MYVSVVQNDDLDKFEIRTKSVQAMQLILETATPSDIQSLKDCAFSPPRDLVSTLPNPDWGLCEIDVSSDLPNVSRLRWDDEGGGDQHLMRV